jgi:hypothetical protein
VPDPTTAAPEGEAEHRLPRDVLPRRYELRIEPDLDAATFSGREDVAVEVVTATDRIVLNVADLEVGEVWVDAGGERVEATASVEGERLSLALASELRRGRRPCTSRSAASSTTS